jgi:hypothetical protein
MGKYGDCYNPDVEQFLKDMSEAGIEKVQWTVYWSDDEDHLYGEPAFLRADGEADWNMPSPDAEDVLWHFTEMLGENGEFELEVPSRTVRRLANAWLPEPELVYETLPQPQAMQI